MTFRGDATANALKAEIETHRLTQEVEDLRSQLERCAAYKQDAEAIANEHNRQLSSLNEWRERLWDEVHVTTAPRKSVLVELGRTLDAILDRTSEAVPTERIFDCAGCGRPIEGQHVAKGIFAYHRECALRSV